MKIEIDANCRRGLRIIPEIPDYQLCRLEGYNGIGKTNAIKLLKLCTGDQPFANDVTSWTTFRSQLLRAKVRLTGLEGAEEIEWTLDPSQWSDRPDQIGNWIGQVRINNRSATIADAQELVRVFHILTTETPVAVLTERLEQSRRTLTSWVAGAAVRRRDSIDVALDQLQQRILDSAPARTMAEVRAVQETSKEVERTQEALARARDSLVTLDEAVSITSRLDQVRGTGHEMDRRISALQNDLAKNESEKRALDIRITEVSSHQSQTEAMQRKFLRAQNNLTKCNAALSFARDRFQSAAARSSVAEGAVYDIAEERTQLGDKLNELSLLLPQVNSTPLLLALVEDLIDRLSNAGDQELAGQTLIDPTFDGRAWTVDDLTRALQRQRDQLASREPTAEADALTSELSVVRERIASLADLEAAQAELDSAEVAYQRAAVRLKATASELPDGEVQSIDDLIAQRQELDQAAASIQERLARISHTRELLGGGLSEEALSAELLSLCKRADVTPARVVGRRDTQRKTVDEIETRLVHVQRDADQLRSDASEHRSRLQGLIEDLSLEHEYLWLRNAIPEITNLAGSSIDEQANFLERLTERLETVRDEVQRAYSLAKGLGASFDNLYGSIQGRSSEPFGSDDTDIYANNWLASEVKQWFDDDLVRSALFGAKATDISVDPGSLMVTWTSQGVQSIKALTAFSSGEQALAYTQARIANIDRDGIRSANRLVALDEFGALIDRDGMSLLAQTLAKRVENAPGDKYLVMLPLEADIDATDRGENSKLRLESLRTLGYFAEEFRP